jgi:putative membrane protein
MARRKEAEAAEEAAEEAQSAAAFAPAAASTTGVAASAAFDTEAETTDYSTPTLDGTQRDLQNDEAAAMGLSGAPLSAEDEALLAIAKEEREISPDLNLELQTQEQDLEVIAILSATNTAVTVMVLAFLYLVGRPRSGAALALHMMYPIDPWTAIEPPPDFIRLLAVTIASGFIAVPIMIKVGKGMMKLHELIPLHTLIISVISFVALLVWLSTGWIGIGVLITGTVMGLMPPRIGIRRSHGMGIILVPIMIYTFAAKVDSFGFT